MRIYLLVFFLIVFSFQSKAQTPADSSATVQLDSINDIDAAPEFPGGEEAFLTFIASNLTYPLDARAQGIEGTVYVTFVVDKDGSISNIHIEEGRGLSPSCDQAAIDAVSKSPRWKPGLHNGVPVRVKRISRIRFTLSDNKKKKR